MTRKFMIEYRDDGPIQGALWYLYGNNLTFEKVQMHCESNQIKWKKQLYRLTELVPLAVDFEVNVVLKEIK